MAMTLLASLIIMAAYFLLLYGGVGFIQDKLEIKFLILYIAIRNSSPPRPRRILTRSPIKNRSASPALTSSAG